MVAGAGIVSAQAGQRGFDHGVFISLKLIFPDANITVVQLSRHHSLDPKKHLGAYGNPQYGPVSDAFDDWLTEAVEFCVCSNSLGQSAVAHLS